jgi:hypothetical protein
MMADYIDWPTLLGEHRYWFMATPWDATSIQSVAGNYMFVRQTLEGWVPVYIGIADDLSSRVPSHDRWADAVAAGATHIMGHTNPTVSLRVAEEAALIAYWQPPLNTQHRGLGSLLGGLGS